MPWRCPRVEADGCRRAAGGLGRASFDFGPKVIKLHGILVQPMPFLFGAVQSRSGGRPFPEAASDSKT
jgi:hypothetical protein